MPPNVCYNLILIRSWPHTFYWYSGHQSAKIYTTRLPTWRNIPCPRRRKPWPQESEKHTLWTTDYYDLSFGGLRCWCFHSTLHHNRATNEYLYRSCSVSSLTISMVNVHSSETSCSSISSKSTLVSFRSSTNFWTSDPYSKQQLVHLQFGTVISQWYTHYPLT